MFLMEQVTIGGKIESTPGTPETLVAADYDTNIRKDEISFSNEIEEYVRKYANGSLSVDTSIMGIQSGSVSFVVDMGVPTTGQDNSPNYSKYLQMCGHAETSYTDVSNGGGIGWDLDSTLTRKTGTIEFVYRNDGPSPDQIVIQYAGCVGSVKYVVARVGQPARLEFTFQGLWNVIARNFASIIVPAIQAQSVPERALGATMTYNSVVQQCESFAIEVQNEVVSKVDFSSNHGIEHFYIKSRNVILTVNPYAHLIATEDSMNNWKNMTTAAFSFVIGSPAQLTWTAPVAQHKVIGNADREGALIWDKTFLLAKDTAVDTEYSLLQGAVN